MHQPRVSTPRTSQDGASLWSLRLGMDPGPWSWARLLLGVVMGALLVPGVQSFMSEQEEELLVELHNYYRGQVSPSASAMLPLVRCCLWRNPLVLIQKLFKVWKGVWVRLVSCDIIRLEVLWVQTADRLSLERNQREVSAGTSWVRPNPNRTTTAPENSHMPKSLSVNSEQFFCLGPVSFINWSDLKTFSDFLRASSAPWKRLSLRVKKKISINRPDSGPGRVQDEN